LTGQIARLPASSGITPSKSSIIIHSLPPSVPRKEACSKIAKFFRMQQAVAAVSGAGTAAVGASLLDSDSLIFIELLEKQAC